MNTIRASTALAGVYRLSGRLDEAEALAVEALRVGVEVLGDANHDTQFASDLLADIHRDQEKREERALESDDLIAEE